MHVVTTKTVTLDSIEIRDIITEHLRKIGTLPEGQKCNVTLDGVPGMVHLEMQGQARPKGIELDRSGACRIHVRWTPSKEDAEDKSV